MAEEGGIGIIDRGFRPGDIEPQVREVAGGQAHAARRHPRPVHDRAEPASPKPRRAMLRSRVGTLVVVDGARKLQGCSPSATSGSSTDSRRAWPTRMTPRRSAGVARGRTVARRRRAPDDRAKVKKLPLVAAMARCSGSSRREDLLRQRRLPFATRDDLGRLRVGAAIGATRRLPRTRGRAAARRCRRARDRHRAWPFDGDGTGDRARSRKRFPDVEYRRATWRLPKARVSRRARRQRA